MKLLPGWIALAVLLATGCSRKDKGQKPEFINAERLIASDNLMYEVGDYQPFTGNAVWFYPSGKIQRKATFKAGKQHGRDSWYYEDGQKAGEAMFQDGLRNGSFKEWFENGQPMSQTEYRNNREEGREIWWYENGKEMSIVSFKAGQRHGPSEGYFDNGSPAWVATWDADQPTADFTEYYLNTNKASTNVLRKSLTRYQKGIRQGPSTGWHRNGAKAWEANWQYGKAVGVFTEWHADGKLKTTTTYEAGERNGPARGYHPNGTNAWEMMWVQGEPHGMFREWHLGGQKLSEIPFEKGERQGVGKEFFVNGQVHFEITFKNDREIALKEYDRNGKQVREEKLPPGRIKAWTRTGFERFFNNKTGQEVHAQLGKPASILEGEWTYEDLVIDDAGQDKTFRRVKFTMENNSVSKMELLD